MSKEKKYGFTRQYHVLLTDKQRVQHEKALETQNALFQYALKYLFKTYGVKHIGRPMPTSQKPIQYVLNKIKAGFIKDKYNLARWKKSALFLSSHSADEFLKTVYTNFSQYRKRLEKAGKSMDEKARYNFKMNVTKDKHGRHKNQLHKSWYRKGSINFLRNGASFRTITSQKLPEDSKGGIRIEDKHRDNHTFLTVADFGTVEVIEDLSELNLKAVVLTKIKKLPDGTYRLQLTFSLPRKKKESKIIRGFDWNMANNEVFCSSDGKRIKVSSTAIKLADEYEQKINKIKSERDQEENIHGNSKRYRKLHRKQQKLNAKRTNLLTNEYRHLVHEVADDCDTIIVEKLDAYEMRKRGKGSAQSKGINRRLTVLKPYELMTVLESLVKKQNKTLIKVDSFWTSKACHECGYINEDLKVGQKEWQCPSCKKMIDRDLNAARNILDWGIHPEHHSKFIKAAEEGKKLSPSSLVTEV
ncbi:transposase [uncultured Lactobacillus sp.]|uniref:RNA-guided endonuclease InsQ/TnpB family protein n=1 Tax=uncultured Lactobacillus sp. TaxID=153152 RepID=UPI0025FC3046|nr:transposase [uncultured Lactobacillus sp.]